MKQHVVPATAMVVSLVSFVGLAACSAPVRDAGSVAHVRLDESSTADQLSDQRQGVLLFDDTMGTAQIARLSQPAEIRGVDVVDGYRAGDVAYWAAESTVVIFTADGSALPRGGLTLIGSVTDGLDELRGCARDCPVRLDTETGAGDGT
jgi:hypothetical protein